MNLKKDYAGQKKRQLFLYEMIAIIKELHPHKYIHNPYIHQITELSELLSIKEQLLLKEVMYCATALNKHSRINNENHLISTREDFVNSLQLVLPKEKRLELKVYQNLKETFQEKCFTYDDVRFKLQIAKSTFKLHVEVLSTYGLIEKSYTKTISGSKLAQFKVVEKTFLDLSSYEKVKESPYHEMMEEFEDVKGYVDLEFRT
jgi:predicted transcriptional regulator